MAISPQEAAARNDKQSLECLASAEKSLDESLRRGYRTGRGVTIAAPKIRALVDDDRQLERVLLQHYRDAGWKIEHHDDQRDGAFYTFSSQR